jgi:hypothetical protein
VRPIVRSTAGAFAPLCLSAGLLMAQPAVQVPDSQLYEIEAENSDIHWLVYSAGPAARFGHNHVISVGEPTGSVLLNPELEQSRFEIEIPVAELVVDDPELRARQGEDFDSVPDEDDIAGTRRNMLSERVLNAEQHPFLRITGTGPTGAPGGQTLDATIELLGRSIPLSIPATVTIDDDTIEASGTFRLTHEMLGMEPFSVMMGALQVGEPLDFSYRVTARRAD